MDPTKPPVKFNFPVQVVKKLQLRKIQVSGGRYDKEVGYSVFSGKAAKELHSDSLQVRTVMAKCRMLAPSVSFLEVVGEAGRKSLERP